MHLYFFLRKVPVIANYNIGETTPEKEFGLYLIWTNSIT